MAGGVAIAESCSCRRSYLLCAYGVDLPVARPKKHEGGRRRMPTSAEQPRPEPGLERMVDLAHRRWPGGGEPRFPLQLWHVGYGHASTRHNPTVGPMSLWTPDGERPVGPATPSAPVAPPDLSADEQAQLAAMQSEMEEVRRQLLDAPASVVIANHAMGIYELAAIHLTAEKPKLPEAVLAIDALDHLVEGLQGRLGDAEPTLREALGQLRAAYLEVRGRVAGDSEQPEP